MNKGLAIIRKYEGLKLSSYLCPAKKWTIGYGSTFYENGSPVKEGERITMERADKLLHHTVGLFEKGVKQSVKVALSDNQTGALVSFAFNVGLAALRRSTLLKKVNANPNDAAIRDEFMKWNRGGGKVLPGLIKRRTEEADLYFG
jgi:lysozyme